MSSVSIFVLPLVQVDAGPASERTRPAPTPGKDLCRLVVGRSPDQRSLSTRQAQATFAPGHLRKGAKHLRPQQLAHLRNEQGNGQPAADSAHGKDGYIEGYRNRTPERIIPGRVFLGRIPTHNSAHTQPWVYLPASSAPIFRSRTTVPRKKPNCKKTNFT